MVPVKVNTSIPSTMAKERVPWRARRAAKMEALPHHNDHNDKSHRVAAKRQSLSIAAIFGICVFSLLELDSYLSSSGGGDGRRSLLSNLYLQATHGTLLPWAHHHLVDVTAKPNPEEETALFWHIPKSGGTTAKRLYQCMGRTLAHRVGADPRYGHDQEKELIVFEPFQGKDWKVANVDTTIKPGILRAKKLGLVQSHTTDMIFTMEPSFAGENLYDEQNKGRVLALFRHPVDRAVSMFYYLQTATWERTYRPEWKNLTVAEWANLPNQEEDYMVRKLVGKSFGDEISEVDLIIAKELVRQRFIVGLMNEMEESIRRFNIVLGVDEENERSKQCMIEFFGPKDVTPAATEEEDKAHATDKKNSNAHPKVVAGDPAYEALASRNSLDMLLFNYIVLLFQEQKSIIDSYFDEPEELPQLEGDSGQEEDTSYALADPENVNVPDVLQGHLVDMDKPFQKRSGETPFFWHVPKSGGTTLQRMFWCLGFTVANEVGGNPKFPPANRNDIVSFSPWKDNPGRVVNVDVSTIKGITEAKSRGFLAEEEDPSNVEVVSTSEFRFATETLFSPKHKARMFALFRHPIDRAVSKFYYLRKATWEPTYNTQWGKMTLDQWASKDRGENNWMVRHLVNKHNSDPLTMKDLEIAKEIIRTKFLIGLMDKFDESVHRFNLFLGVDENNDQNKKCIIEFTTSESKTVQVPGKKNEKNSYSHPEAERGGAAWVNLSKIHFYDILLYRYIVEQFREQGALFQPTAVN